MFSMTTISAWSTWDKLELETSICLVVSSTTGKMGSPIAGRGFHGSGSNASGRPVMYATPWSKSRSHARMI